MENHAESKFPIRYIMEIDQMPTDHSFGHPVQIQLYRYVSVPVECTVLYCTIVYCTVLYCIVLRSTVC